MTHPEPPRWKIESEKTLIDSPVMKVVEQQCRSSDDGKPHRFYILRSNDWVNIIPVTEDGKVVMIRQFRVGIGSSTLEIPGGVVEDSDSHLLQSALREMTEETGYEPVEGAQTRELGWTYVNPAIFNNKSISFIVGPVSKRKTQNLDPGERIETEEIPIAKIPELIKNGTITHSLILNAFQHLTLQDLSQTLQDQLNQFTHCAHPSKRFVQE